MKTSMLVCLCLALGMSLVRCEPDPGGSDVTSQPCPDTVSPVDTATPDAADDAPSTDSVVPDLPVDLPVDLPADLPVDTGDPDGATPDTTTLDPCSPPLNPGCEATVCELADGTPGRCSWLSNGLCGCAEDCGDATQSWHVAIEQNPMLTNCGTTTNIPVAAATNCTDAIAAAWDLLLLIADCLNPCCPPGSTISQGTSACTVDPYTYASGAPATRYQVDWTYTCTPTPPPEPNPCATCETDADCFGGYVCADALNTWDDPATPNICTQPCWGQGVCPAGMFCDFSVSKYCQCDQPSVDLSLAKTVSDATPDPGDTVMYSVTITNNSAATATGVQVTDVLPAGVTFASFGGASFGTYDATTGVWTIPSIPPFTYGNVVLYVTVDASANGAIVNTAEITAAGQPDPDSTPANGVVGEDDLASVTITVTQPVIDLSLAKTVSNAAPHPGDTILYSVTVTNGSAFPATGVQVTDVLPAGVTFASFGGASFGTFDVTTGVWSIPSIPPFTYGNLVLYVTVDASASGAIVNTAEVTAAGQQDVDSTPANGVVTEDDLAFVTITVTQPAVDLSLKKTVSNAAPFAGTTILYSVTIANSSAFTATGVQVTDVLPAGVTFASFGGASFGTFDVTTGIWTIASIPPFTYGNLVLYVTVDASASGVIVNTAEVTAAGQPDPDSTPANGVVGEDDLASASITVQHQPCDPVVNPTCEPKECKLPDGTPGKCDQTAVGCGCQPVVVPSSACLKCDSDATCSGGLTCQDDDNNPLTPKVCTIVYDPATGCPAGTHGDFAFSKYCICEDCGAALNPTCDSLECTTPDGKIGKCKLVPAGCECAI